MVKTKTKKKEIFTYIKKIFKHKSKIIKHKKETLTITNRIVKRKEKNNQTKKKY